MFYDSRDDYFEDMGPEPPEDHAEQDAIDEQERREFEENGPYE